MNRLSLLVLALGLAMDATAAAAARGMLAPQLRARHFVIVAVWFGGAQGLMPWLGALLGAQMGDVLAAWDHWIAFALLAGIGVKMIMEAFAQREVPDAERAPFAARTMLLLAIATSIDAFAAGLTLRVLDVPIVQGAVMIGLVTAVLSALGLALGRRFGDMLGKRLDVLGGALLVLLGIKILFEHLSA